MKIFRKRRQEIILIKLFWDKNYIDISINVLRLFQNDSVIENLPHVNLTTKLWQVADDSRKLVRLHQRENVGLSYVIAISFSYISIVFIYIELYYSFHILPSPVWFVQTRSYPWNNGNWFCVLHTPIFFEFYFLFENHFTQSAKNKI